MKTFAKLSYKAVVAACLALFATNAYSAPATTYVSKAGEYKWHLGTSWVGGVAPTNANNTAGDVVNIGSATTASKIILETSYVPTKTTSIHVFPQCTLVVAYAELDLNNQSNNNTDLQVDAGGVLIVLGNLVSLKNLSVVSGGKVVVLGDISTGDTGNDLIENTGNFYTVGSFIDNGVTVSPSTIINTTGAGTQGGLDELLAYEPEIVEEILANYPDFATGISANIVYAMDNGNWSTMTWNRIGTTVETAPGANDMVVIGGYAVTLDQTVTVKSLVINKAAAISTLTVGDASALTATNVVLNNSSTVATVGLSAAGTGVVTTANLAFNGAAANNTFVQLNDDAVLSVTSSLTKNVLGSILVHDNARISIAGYNAKTFYASIGGIPVAYENLNIYEGGVYAVDGSVTVSGSLNMTDGILSTTGGSLTLSAAATSTGGSNASYVDGALTRIGTGAFTFPVGAGGFYAPVTIAPASLSTYTAQYFASAPANRTAREANLAVVSGEEYWDLHKQAGVGTKVTLHFPDAVRSKIIIPEKLVLAHWNSGSGKWENMGRDASSANSVTSAFMNNFSPVTAGGETPATLPVELIGFSARVEANFTKLNWATSSESDNDFFTLQRSFDGKKFSDIAKVMGVGNSSVQNDYSTIDHDAATGILYYRLLQTDFDGTTKTVATASVVRGQQHSADTMLLRNNLIKGVEDLLFDFTAQSASTVSVQLYNAQIQSLWRESFNMDGGKISGFQLDADLSLTKGLYYVQCTINEKLFIETFMVE